MMKTASVARFLSHIYLRLPVRPFQSVLVKLFWAYRLSNRNKLVIDTIDGVTYELDLQSQIENSIYYSGCYEPATVNLIDKLVKQGMTVLDIGANIGCYTFRFAKLVGDSGVVIAFEPTSSAFSKLKRNSELNPFKNITLERLALSDISHKDTAGFISHWPMDMEQGLSVDREQINFITLDDYLIRNNVNKIDFIKLDVDGHECRVIRGGLETLRRFKPTMIIEMSNLAQNIYGDNLADLIDILGSLGYKLYSESRKPYYTKEAILQTVFSHGSINFLCHINHERLGNTPK